MRHFHDLPGLHVVLGSLEGFPSNMPSYILWGNAYEKQGYGTPATETVHSPLWIPRVAKWRDRQFAQNSAFLVGGSEEMAPSLKSMDTRYCLTQGCEAGLPIPKSSFHFLARPRSTNKERNLTTTIYCTLN